MRPSSASGGKFKVRSGGCSGGGGGGGGGWFGWCGYLAGDGCGGAVLVMDVADGESVAAADIVGVVVVNVVIVGPETGSSGGMAGGEGGGGLDGALGPKA